MGRSSQPVDPELIETYNQAVIRLYVAEAAKGSVVAEYETRKQELVKEFEQRMQDSETEARAAKADVARIFKSNQQTLTVPGKKSFVTTVAVTKLRDQPGRRRVVDWKVLLKAARKLGIVRRIAKMKVNWVGDSAKFFAYFDRHPEHRAALEPYIDTPEDGELLIIAPNSGHVVYHDGERISPESVTIWIPKS